MYYRNIYTSIEIYTMHEYIKIYLKYAQIDSFNLPLGHLGHFDLTKVPTRGRA